MSLDFPSRVSAAEHYETDFDREGDSLLVENLVMAAGAAFTVLFVSSIAVLMYLA